MQPISFPICKSLGQFFLDTLVVEPSGLVRLSGWSKSGQGMPDAALLWINGKPIEPSTAFRVVRPDLSRLPLAGFAVDFVIPSTLVQSIDLLINQERAFSARTRYQTIDPHFNQLFLTDEVFGREQLYTSANLPPLDVNDDILRLSSLLFGRTLDFGCGRGGLLRELRRRGIEGEGLEIDNPALRESLAQGVEGHVRFYDGAAPLPFDDSEFDSTVAAEVIEHVPHFRDIIDEIARITRSLFIMTVPDMSSIPICFPHYCVPWHLLEGDHRNFFTQNSLNKVLRTRFAHIEFFRICPHTIDGTMFYTSLAAVARK